jgi:hypothetical protein
MSRRPQMRGAHDGPEPAPRDDARRAWLSHWKEWAIEQVPASASATTRSRVRLEVERALARLGAQDPENEVRDMVQATLDPILQEFAGRDADAAHARQKQEHLEQVEIYLEIALLLVAGPRTTAMLRRPEYAKPVLTERLRRRLHRTLTGAESHPEVLEQTIAFLDRCLAKQQPPPRQWGRRIATGTFVTTVAAAKVLEQNPELRELVSKGFAAGQKKLRAALARVTAARKPPTS